MQVKDFDELETQLNEIGARLSIVASLGKILLESVYENYDLKPQDVQNLTLTLKDKIEELKKEFNSIQESLIS